VNRVKTAFESRLDFKNYFRSTGECLAVFTNSSRQVSESHPTLADGRYKLEEMAVICSKI
jgi:hypothetical protein